jgi:hypothetical protein
MRLDRDASEANAAWESVARGDLLSISPAPELERTRIGADSGIETPTFDASDDAGQSAPLIRDESR